MTVVAYLRSTYGYEVDMVVGHSRGSVAGMHWLCTSEEGKRVRAFVNVSGRYRMHVSPWFSLFSARTDMVIIQRIYGDYGEFQGLTRYSPVLDGAKAYQEEFAAKGYYDWNVVVARKAVVQKIYPHDLEEFSRWKSSIVWDQFPLSIHVLTIHGLADETVPV